MADRLSERAEQIRYRVQQAAMDGTYRRRENHLAQTTSMEWFAWRPVRLGALGTGRLVWLRWVKRIRTITPWGESCSIYQPLD